MHIQGPFVFVAGIDPYDAGKSAPSELVSFTNGFHGRTMGALALTYKQQYKTPFMPMIGGTSCVPWMDFDAAASAIKKVLSTHSLSMIGLWRELLHRKL